MRVPVWPGYAKWVDLDRSRGDLVRDCGRRKTGHEAYGRIGQERCCRERVLTEEDRTDKSDNPVGKKQQAKATWVPGVQTRRGEIQADG